MGVKLHGMGKSAGGGEYYCLRCPGCARAHIFEVPSWSLTGTIEVPTVRPSIRCKSFNPTAICHFYVTDGKIEFCADSSHALAGQTVELPDWIE